MMARRTAPLGVVVALAVLATLAGVVAGCGEPATPQSATERFTEILGHAPTGRAKAVAALGVLVVADASDYEPASWVNDKKELVGFDVDVAREVGKILGLKVQFINPNWDAVPTGLKAGTFDVSIGSLAPTADLKAALSFTAPYYYMPAQLAVKKGSAELTGAAQLAGKTVGAAVQSAYFYWLQANTQAVLRTYGSDADTFPELAAGRLDAILAGGPTLKQAIDDGQPFVLSGKPLFYQDLCFAVQKSQKDLVAVFDDAIKKMQTDGTISDLSQEWFRGMDLSKAGS
jgi:polar amino acid transport system substrate-binding protein